MDYLELKKMLVGKTIKEVAVGGGGYYNEQDDCILEILFEDNSILELAGDDGCCVVENYKNKDGTVLWE